MKTLLMAPELFRSEGGISRILRLYLRALAQLAGPGDRVGYIALNDLPVTADRVHGCIGREAAFAVACDRSKLHFIMQSLRHGIIEGRIICGHLHQLPVVAAISLLNPTLKYYLIAHGIEVWRPFSLIEKWALRRAHRILCVSEYTRRQMLRFDSGLDTSRLVVLPNTFDPEFGGQRTEDGRSREAEMAMRSVGPKGRESRVPLGAGDGAGRRKEALSSRRDDGPVILTVARLTKADAYKGVDTMIEAMPGILREYPKAQLRIVGGGDDLPRLQAIAETLKLGNAVTFTGILSDEELRQEYQACDLFALPSRKEGFGLVYLEAMAFGKPCLAARAGGAPEVVNDDVGAVVEYGNTDQIALAVGNLMRHPRGAAAMYARIEVFSFPRFQQRLQTALN